MAKEVKRFSKTALFFDPERRADSRTKDCEVELASIVPRSLVLLSHFLADLSKRFEKSAKLLEILTKSWYNNKEYSV